jgi:murein DD-endopeptidase MepM/ murein hydrolase activator NlpD
MKTRLTAAAVIATLLWLPHSVQAVNAIYCYPGDPPAVYQACLAYNQGIGQQVANQQQLKNIQYQINNTLAQMNAINSFISGLNKQISAQQALIAQTQSNIDDLNRRIRLGQAGLIRLQADMAVRDELLNARIRYVDSRGALDFVELILTAKSFNDMMNRIIASQQIAASDKQLLQDLNQSHAQVAVANSDLGVKRGQVSALLQQQQAAESDLQKTKKTQVAALAFEQQLEVQLNAQYQAVQAERAKIDALVAQLAQKYDAAAAKAGGGTGVFAWPMPSCGPSCISQGFGCSQFYFEIYDPNCPWPHRIHTGIDIAGPYGADIIAADTGIAYLYPGSWGYGNLLVIIHGHGYETYYAHLSGYAPGLSTGQIVPRGTTVAFEGSTGNSTGPHLHFEIRYNGVYKNPCIWLGC